jgi:GNAT superfamily N-acetyltransferase
MTSSISAIKVTSPDEQETAVSDAFEIRAARPGDEAAIVEMIRELAEYERLLDEVVITPGQLREHLFGERPAVEALLVWVGERPVAYALFFPTFSTFLGRPGLYLEDLYVRPDFRRRGIAGAVMRHLAGICRERGCGRFEWAVLTWNELAGNQYRKMGAAPLEDWRLWRLDGEALQRLAEPLMSS